MCLTAFTALAGMAGSKLLAPKAPKVSLPDPAAERAAANTAAAQAANSKLAMRNRSRAASSLIAPGSGGGGVVSTTGPTAYGKSLLGQ